MSELSPVQVYTFDDTIWGVWAESASAAIGRIANKVGVVDSAITIRKVPVTCVIYGKKVVRYIGVIDRKVNDVHKK